VDESEGQALAAKFGCPFYETSAKDKINNEICFIQLVREIRRIQAASNEKPVVEKKKPRFCSIL